MEEIAYFGLLKYSKKLFGNGFSLHKVKAYYNCAILSKQDLKVRNLVEELKNNFLQIFFSPLHFTEFRLRK